MLPTSICANAPRQTVAKVPTKCQGVIPATAAAAEHACNEMRPSMWHRGPDRQWLCDVCFDRVAPRHAPIAADAAPEEPAAEEDDGAEEDEEGEEETKAGEQVASGTAAPVADAPAEGDGKMVVE